MYQIEKNLFQSVIYPPPSTLRCDLVGAAGLEPAESEDAWFTAKCNCHYATHPNGVMLALFLRGYYSSRSFPFYFLFLSHQM